MSDILIFLDEHSEDLKKKLDSLNIGKDNLLFLTYNEETFFLLQKLSHPVFFLLELLTADDIEDTNQRCYGFIRLIFSEENNRFKYNSLPMGHIIEMYLIPYFIRIFQDIIFTEKAIKHFKYDRIIVAGAGDFLQTVRLALRQKGIPFESWFGGWFNQHLYVLKKFWEGRKNLWTGKPFRDLFVSPAQNFVLIVDSLLWKLRSLIKKTKGKDPDSVKKTFVFSADGHTYEIYKALLQSGHWDFLTFGLYYRFRKNQLKEVTPLEVYLRLSHVFKSVRAFISFLSAWMSIRKDKEFQKEFKFMGVNYWSRIRKLIKFNMLISFPILFLDYLIAVEAFKKHPRSVLVITASQPPYNMALLYAAKQCGVRSVVVQHGIGTTFPTIDTDYHAGWGRRAIEWYGEHDKSNEAERVCITGSPLCDKYAAMKKELDRESILAALHLPPDKKIILLLTEWVANTSVFGTVMQDFYMVDAVVEAVLRLNLGDKVHIVIKPHPSADMQLLKKYCEIKDLCSHAGLSIINDNLPELLFISDICVSSYSTTLLEAMFFKKPLIVFDYFMKKEFVPYVSKGAALGASNKEEMASAIKAILYDKTVLKNILNNQKDFIEYAAYRLDGRSIERVCRLIEKIIKGEKPPQYM